MEKLVTASSLNSEKGRITFTLPLPNKCPICSVAYADVPIEIYYTEKPNDGYKRPLDIYAMYFCPYCERVFFAQYYALDDLSIRNPYAVLSKTYPSASGVTAFSTSISNLSSKFIEIYHQSEKAENSGFSEICGMGYRKALEFLIKDYLITINPDDAPNIESSLLGKCIATYIENEKIKTLATASAWLGNDETHYTRKHQDYNIQDLKRFINTVVAFIEYELNYSEAFDFLSNPRQS